MSLLKNQEKTGMPFGEMNYKRMLIGLVVLLIGFFIMSMDGEEFGFGFLGLTLGPLVVLIGFGLQFWTILGKTKESKE